MSDCVGSINFISIDGEQSKIEEIMSFKQHQKFVINNV